MGRAERVNILAEALMRKALDGHNTGFKIGKKMTNISVKLAT